METIVAVKAISIGKKGQDERIVGVNADGMEVVLRGRCASGRYNTLAIHSTVCNSGVSGISAYCTMHSRPDLAKPAPSYGGAVIDKIIKILTINRD